MKAILVIGNREWADRETVYMNLLFVPKGTQLITGKGNDGAEGYVRDYARINHRIIRRIGGPRRNEEQLTLLKRIAGEEGQVLVFDDGRDVVARDCVRRAKRLGLKVVQVAQSESLGSVL